MRLPIIVLAAFAVGCGSTMTDPNADAASIPRATMIALDISPDSAVLALGEVQAFAAVKVMSDGSRIPVIPRWRLAQPGIAVIGFDGSAMAVGVGTVEIRAVLDNREARAVMTVLRPDSLDDSSALTVESFSMVEFKYPSLPGHWFYAPQIRVRAARGHLVTVLTLDFAVPGLPSPIPSIGCGATIPSGAPVELNGEVYGDWSFSIDNSAHRATGDSATMVLSYTNKQGVRAERKMKGAIVAGSLPGTYGADPGACFRGYRAPG